MRKLLLSSSTLVLVIGATAGPVAAHVVATTARYASQAQVAGVSVVLLGGCAIAAAVVLTMQGRIAVSRSVLLPGLGLLGWTLIAAAASGRGWSALAGEAATGIGWLSLLAGALVAFAAAGSTRVVATFLARWAPWLVAVQAAVTALQLAGALPGNAGTLPNSTYLGEYLVLLLPWVLAPWDGSIDRRSLIRLGVTAAGLATLGATGSRVALVAALAWFAWTALTRPTSSARTKTVVVGALTTAGIAAAFAFARSELLGSLDVRTLGLRLPMWDMSWRAFLARPLTGWGPDGLNAGGGAVSTIDLARLQPHLLVVQPEGRDPHSMLAWLLVSTGLVGVVLAGWLVVAAVRSWLASSPASAVRPAAWAVSLFVVVALTAPIGIQVLALAAVVAGLSVAAGGVAQESERGAGLTRAAVVSAALAVALLTANALARLPYGAFGGFGSVALAPRAEAASDAWPFDPYLASLAAEHAHSVPGDGSAERRAAISRLISRANAADRHNAYHPLYEAVALRDRGADPATVEAAFSESFRRYPFHPIGRAEYALFLAQQGRDAEAHEQLDIARLGDQTQFPGLRTLIDRALEDL